jgi:hypothetical protein
LGLLSLLYLDQHIFFTAENGTVASRKRKREIHPTYSQFLGVSGRWNRLLTKLLMLLEIGLKAVMWRLVATLASTRQ